MAARSGTDVHWVSVPDQGLDICHRRSEEHFLLLVDDADLMPAALQEELTRLVEDPAARIVMSWDPARRTIVDAQGPRWRAALRRVEHLTPLSVDEIEEAFGYDGFEGFGRPVAGWTAGIHLFVWFCLQHALASRPGSPEELWATVSTAGPATDLVDTVLASRWRDPAQVARVLRLLALAGGERAPYLLAAPFLPHQDPAAYQDAMDELTRAGLADERSWQIVPPVLAQAVDSALTAAERDDAQRSIATALRDRGYDAGTVARHLVGIREPRAGWELDTLREATVQVPAELSQAEARVALLAVRGLRNREIAQTLCIGLRTVETHLTHIYRKLGVRGRVGLVAAMTLSPDGGRLSPPGRSREHGSVPERR